MGARPPFRAVIFDMDGVLTDSEPAFFLAVNDILARYETSIEMEDYARFIGSATDVTWAGIIEIKRLPVALADVTAAFEEPLMQRLRETRPALPGARQLVEKLRAHRVPVALCTASYMRWVDAILGSAGLSGMFDVLSTADMVERTKPDPAAYAHAAAAMRLTPEECVAIEDSTNGLNSATGAGCHVIQLRATETAAPPHPGAAHVLDSLAAFPLDLVLL